MGRPQNEQEFLNYFYSLIGRTIDTWANDWAAVLSKEYLWNGSFIRIPNGPLPGVQLGPDAPFYGLTQQWSGGPKARIFLPTALPDENNYYTRNIQYIKDTPGGVHGTDFLWDWKYISGHPYVPIEEGGDVSVPNEFAIVSAVDAEHPELLERNTETTILQFMQMVASRLVAKDSNWGYLTKTPAEKHLTLPNGQFISVDSFCYSQSQQRVVDTISNAVDPGEANPTWIEKERRPENVWYPISNVAPPSSECNCKDEIAQLQSQINALNERVARLEASDGTSDLTGKKIALKAESNGRWLCADKEKNANEPPVIANRNSPGPWETFEIQEK